MPVLARRWLGGAGDSVRSENKESAQGPAGRSVPPLGVMPMAVAPGDGGGDCREGDGTHRYICPTRRARQGSGAPGHRASPKPGPDSARPRRCPALLGCLGQGGARPREPARVPARVLAGHARITGLEEAGWEASPTATPSWCHLPQPAASASMVAFPAST